MKDGVGQKCEGEERTSQSRTKQGRKQQLDSGSNLGSTRVRKRFSPSEIEILLTRGSRSCFHLEKSGRSSTSNCATFLLGF